MPNEYVIEIETKGPVFDGRAARYTDALLMEAVDEVTEYGWERVLHNLNRSLKTQTPYYVTQVNRHRRGTFERQIDDSGVIYGPWLEGTGSRNATTRFRGYASFRRAYQTALRQTPRILRTVSAKWLPRMGGR